MIFIFNELAGDAKMFKLIIAEPETGNSDLYVRFGFNFETDQVFYFRNNKLIPALSTACYVGLFTVTN